MSNKVAAVFVPITIKSVKDAEAFLSDFKGYVYIPCDDIDLCIETLDDTTEVSWRLKSERGDLMSPYIIADNPSKLIYDNREYINAWHRVVCMQKGRY